MTRRILFITATRIGDAVLSTGLLDWLTRTYPDARVTIACGPLVVPLFQRHPGADEVIAMRKRKRAGHWRDLWRSVRGKRWDIVVDLRRSLLPWLVSAKRRASVPRGRPGEHRVELVARTLKLHSVPSPRLWLTDADRARGAEGIGTGEQVIAVAPTANWAAKVWPAERFAELVTRLTAPGAALADARVFVTGGPDEEELVGPVTDALPPERLVVRMGLDLPATAAAFERSRIFIGNDSGLMHMAAAVGTPTVGLFGPTRDEHYAPWGTHTRVVRTEEEFEMLVGAPGFDHRTTGSLMAGLSVAKVEKVAKELLENSDSSAAAGERVLPSVGGT